MTTQKGGAGVTLVVIVIILIIAGALFFMNRGNSTDVAVDEASTTPTEDVVEGDQAVQGATTDVEVDAGVAADADASAETGAVAE